MAVKADVSAVDPKDAKQDEHRVRLKRLLESKGIHSDKLARWGACTLERTGYR